MAAFRGEENKDFFFVFVERRNYLINKRKGEFQGNIPECYVACCEKKIFSNRIVYQLESNNFHVKLFIK